MAVKTHADIDAEIDSLLPDNAPDGTLTPAIVRGILHDINDSVLNTTTNTNLIGAHIFDATKAYYSGDLTMYLGVWYQANATVPITGSFDPTYFDRVANNVYQTSLTIATADVLILNGTPLEVVAAVTGKTIVVVQAFLKVTFNTVEYATNTTAELYTDTAVLPQYEFLSGLNASVTRSYLGRPKVTAPAATDTQLIISKSLKIRVQTGNPTAGNSAVVVQVYYMLV